MRSLLVLAGALTVVVSVSSCSKPTGYSMPQNYVPREVSEIKNAPWILTRASFDGISVNLNNYEPFHFLFSDTNIYGDNGSAEYWGGCTFEGQTLEVDWISKWSIGGDRNLNPCCLVGRWSFRIGDSTIQLTSANSSMYFKSRYTAPVTGQSFCGKTWKLWFSNDTAFGAIGEMHLTTKLEMSDSRTFWLRCTVGSVDSGLIDYAYYGAYGIDGHGGVYIYPNGWQGFGEDLTDPNEFLRRICESSEYSVANGFLTLAGNRPGFYYRFVLD